jgi:hypothetical protein
MPEARLDSTALGSCGKMSRDEFTTFRWPRRDSKNYRVGELLQVVIKPRSNQRRPMGVVVVVKQEELRSFWSGGNCITDEMARQDGFRYATELVCYLNKERPSPSQRPAIVYRYTLKWIYRLSSDVDYLSFIENGELVITNRTLLKGAQPDVVARVGFSEVAA